MSDEIRPFKIDIADCEITDLRARLERTRWPEAETVDDWSQGIPLAYVRDLCGHWGDGYDWRRCETGLNSHPNFVTEINGLDIHFQHIRSPHDEATPLIITHGWPGSIVEFQKVIAPLTDPTAHGGSPGQAFHIVLPSIPGFGWSAKPASTGTGVGVIAAMWDELMARLGYHSYIAQGGDWGSAITTAIGVANLGHCQAIHINMPVAAPTPESMADPTPQEMVALEALGHYDKWDSGYSKQQSTRPQTLGYGLTDSPAGQAAWIAEKMWAWTDCDGHPENALSRDEILDNISVYWFTKSASSSARLYWESFADFGTGTVEIPTGCSIFPKEIIRCSRRWAEERYSSIGYWNELDHGGHFAAWEQPELYVNEIRSFLSTI